tara:strand:+ start:2492 stop:3355 length:864 start_codon:yes stop_codon:yes gene_type:complete
VRKFQIKSYTKINLSLRVLKKARKNYHNINSLITFCHPYDLITIQRNKNSFDKIIFTGKFKKGINKKFNTLSKALILLREKGFLKKQYFNIYVKKNIPHGSGLGGGSSNAAVLLNFLSKKMRLKLNKNLLNKIAKKIGFDVPILLEKKNTIILGNKNKILRIKKKLNLKILIVFPNIICSTKKIYNNNKKFTRSPIKFKKYINEEKKLINFIKNEKNDLESTVIKLYPKTKKVINFIKVQRGCYFSRITGSGSACIGIFSDIHSLVLAQKLIRQKFPKYWSAISKTM